MPDLIEPAPISKTPEENVEEFIASISQEDITRYAQYWDTITPKTHEEYYKRWIFAYLSVHTTWTSNVRAYIHLDSEKAITEKEQLMQLIVASRVGLHKVRTDGIWKFKNDFWSNPDEWYKKPEETWPDFRDRVMNKCHGLGYAKSSFALELCYPNTCEVTCLDTHMLQLYKVKSSPGPSPSKYKELEQHWITKCKSRGIPAFMVRNVYWDKTQGKTDTRYWSHIFEIPTTTPIE